jgi:hypothetical protein
MLFAVKVDCQEFSLFGPEHSGCELRVGVEPGFLNKKALRWVLKQFKDTSNVVRINVRDDQQFEASELGRLNLLYAFL